MQYKWLKCTETVSLLSNGLAGMIGVHLLLVVFWTWGLHNLVMGELYLGIQLCKT